MNRILFIMIFASIRLTCFAQIPPEKLIKVTISPDHADWIYKVGEKVKFVVKVTRFNVPVRDLKLDYQIGQERLEPTVKKTGIPFLGNMELDGGTLREPGFLRCIVTAEVNGVKYKGLATVGFEPERIKAVAELPADFSKFWDQGKKELSDYPLDAKMVLIPERCTEKASVFQVNIQGYGKGSRVYGILCIPTKPGKYPALLKVPGAGIRPYAGDIALAEKGMITLEIGIHGIPVDMQPNVYASLAGGALNNYQNFNLDDKNKFYYKRVYLNCLRANDFLVSLSQFNGKDLGVTGGSQGGALSVVTAALDNRVTCLAAMYPALSDLTATFKKRAAGWPQYFESYNYEFNNKKDKISTCGYYDVANFAQLIKVPGFFTWGFNDEVCPPTSMYAAYNNISSIKILKPFPDTGHWAYGEQYETLNNWLFSNFQMEQTANYRF
ncbi:acetylxylan esterase [Pedobacter frigiditerrae]|uniref:Acetylxylan esterase n=1 Tax=Pedobacter frigiditerrae TaxID=2530452 RepID=A0A4R0MPI5_9SPHI|nr:acetylxylan esterase [Pedobacter frigiditerrae]TCC88720.1 acetylxylan esterase [Pedobacter frigiditerrae]